MDALLVLAGMALTALLVLVLILPPFRARLLELEDERDAWRARCLELDRLHGLEMEGGFRLLDTPYERKDEDV